VAQPHDSNFSFRSPIFAAEISFVTRCLLPVSWVYNRVVRRTISSIKPCMFGSSSWATASCLSIFPETPSAAQLLVFTPAALSALCKRSRDSTQNLRSTTMELIFSSDSAANTFLNNSKGQAFYKIKTLHDWITAISRILHGSHDVASGRS
jgi:hypothetical protein